MTLIKRLVVSILIGSLLIIVFFQQILKFKERDKQISNMMKNENENVQLLKYSFHESCNCSRSFPNFQSLIKSIDFDKLPDGSYVGKLSIFYASLNPVLLF